MGIDLKELIEDVIFKFSQNRTGPKPRVFAKIPPDLPHIFWQDEGLERFIKHFLYHALLVNNPEMPVQVSVHQRNRLTDLESFIGVFPVYWIQLIIEAHGSGIIESVVEEVFNDLGYRCEEWVGVEGSYVQLGIFRPIEKEEPKMVFCLDWTPHIRKFDLLIPISERLLPLPCLPIPNKKT